MFLENSRYFGKDTLVVKLSDGRSVVALQPRVLPDVEGITTPLQRHDRLDVIALRQYQDATRFWHVADANTQTDSRLLTDPPAANSETPPVPTLRVPPR